MPEAVLKLDGSGPLYDQIRRAITRKITRRDWRPGDRIPFENELCRALNVSRMTVNKAMQALADDGLIVRKRKAGSFVAAQEHVQAPLTIARIEDEVEASGRLYGYELLSRGESEMEGGPGLRILCLHLADGEPMAVDRPRVRSRPCRSTPGRASCAAPGARPGTTPPCARWRWWRSTSPPRRGP